MQHTHAVFSKECINAVYVCAVEHDSENFKQEVSGFEIEEGGEGELVG